MGPERPGSLGRRRQLDVRSSQAGRAFKAPRLYAVELQSAHADTQCRRVGFSQPAVFGADMRPLATIRHQICGVPAAHAAERL